MSMLFNILMCIKLNHWIINWHSITSTKYQINYLENHSGFNNLQFIYRCKFINQQK